VKVRKWGSEEERERGSWKGVREREYGKSMADCFLCNFCSSKGRGTQNLPSPCLLCVLRASVVKFFTVQEKGTKEYG
jgi:hypothetical protein